MTNRELSEKLADLADILEDLSEGNQSNTEYQRRLLEVADELHSLSLEKYTPGTTTWADLKKNNGKPSKKPRYHNLSGRIVPF